MPAGNRRPSKALRIRNPVAAHGLAVGAFLVSLGLVLGSSCAFAIEDRADVDPNDRLDPGEVVSWKATVSNYRDSVRGQAYDLNLRGNTADFAFWLGEYREAGGFDQTRVGTEYGHRLLMGRLVGSLQAATGGFLGWSLTWDGKQEGRPGFAPLVGFGRTNNKPYYNLNFDPNDSILAGGTFSSPAVGVLMLYQIRDDRLHTGQRVNHLVWRKSLSQDRRITLDAFSRRGAEAPGEPVYCGLGATLTLDLGDTFLRLGYDPKANYTDANIARIAAGIRF